MTPNPIAPLVGIVMGSRSDWETMQHAAQKLEALGVPFEVKVVSAHRTPDVLFSYAEEAGPRGLRAIIAGAGGAAHLPGMVASATPLPVIGVPRALENLEGMDSMLSIVQMPGGVPVATVGVGGAKNAGLLAVRILSAGHPELVEAMEAYQADMRDAVLEKDRKLRENLMGE